MPNTVIQLKKSATPSSTPSDLANGELAINFADGKLFYKNTSGFIAEFSSSVNSFGTVNANGTLVVSDTSGDILTLLAGPGISITGDAVNDRITFTATGNAVASFDAANVSNSIAIAAFAKANAALANTTGTFEGTLTIKNDLIVNGNTNIDAGTLYVDATNNRVGIGTTTPNAKFEIIPSNTMPTTLSVGGLSIKETGNKTYPTTSNFTVTPGISQNIEVGGTQTINSGFNFIYGIQNTLTKSNGNTQDIERTYFNGFVQNFNWGDQNTCKQYVGIQDSFIYYGCNANGRTSSAFTATAVYLAPNAQTQTISTATSPNLVLSGQSLTGNTDNVNITDATGYKSLLFLYNLFSGTHNYTITNYSAFETASGWGTSGTTGTANTTITNYYGLRLRSPSSATGLTVTNNFGISQEWANSKNYFAGNIGIGLTTPTARLAVANGTSGTSQHIYGTYTDASNYERINITANTTGHYIIGEEGGTGSARPLYLGANNAIAATIDASGNVGIGTTNPTSNLHVIGTANVTSNMTVGGNVGIGTAAPAYKLEVAGSFAAQTKSFIINHQSKPDHKLRYGSLEGPENGVYIRGKSTSNIIELPDYWTWLVDEDSITVNVTPIGKKQKLFVEKIKNNKVYIKNAARIKSDVNYFYTVYAERKDVDKLIAEIPNP
jgi:hypothetical protein